jgi:hypothetical protein
MRTRVVRANDYIERISRHHVNAEWLGDKLGKQAEEEDDWLFDVYFGFDLLQAPENGNLPSRVECCLVVSNPLGLSVAFLTSCSGRVSSKSAAADLCVPETGGVQTGSIWRRQGVQARKAAQKLRDLHGEYWNEMETLGAMASD